MKYDTLWRPSSGETIVFTGSSSIRLWQDIPELFPDYNIVNTGFGGSQTSDLIAYSNELVLRFRPRQVFIYEGDNDLSDGKRPRKVMKDTKTLIRQIQDSNASVNVVLIAAKPSITRWSLRRRYKRFNKLMYKLSRDNANLDFADVWTAMTVNGKLQRELFIEDGLHMNAKGYQIWYGVIKEFIK
jgi:lysophospholipase L1-like esterase